MMPILFWVSYFILWMILFVLNLLVFELITPFSVKNEIFETQNKAVWRIVRWQLIGQWIMFWSLIYFLWLSYNHNLNMANFSNSAVTILEFGWLGIVVFQTTLYILSKVLPIQKEIIVDTNESLAGIIEWFLIAISIIISVSLYS